ncbi:MAG TPA: diguanylate cyclase [Candidatus Limnocylindria bacterium]|nr:diguanylate cyclase [Candidatus Limnocylindria bacterium]
MRKGPLDGWWERRSSRALLVGSAVAVAAWLLERRVDPAAGSLVADATFTGFGLIALVACALASRRARADERLAWLWLAAGAGVWLLGQLFWDIYDLLGVGLVTPAPSDLCFLLAAPLFALGFVTFLVRAGQRLAVYALLIDVGTVVLTLLAVVALSVSRVFGEMAREPLTTTIALLYPVLYVGATGAALSTLWGMPTARPRAAFVLLASAMSLDTVVFTLWLPQYVAGTQAAGSPLDLGIMLGKLLLAAGAVRAIEDRDDSVTSALSREMIHQSRLILPAVLSVAAAFVLVASQLDRSTGADAAIALAIAATIVLLATRAGLALYTNYRVGEEERRRARQYEALYDVGLETSNERSVDELVQLVVDRVTDLTRTDGSLLALAEPGRGYVVRALRKPIRALRDSVGEPLVGIGRAAVEARELVAAREYAGHPQSNPLLHGDIASAMSAPLIVRGEVIGVLTVYASRRRSFSEGTQRLFRLYAAQAANAISTARLLEESRVLARQDALTGTLNRRSLVERLEAEIAEARRHGDALCVVMCDLDGLKEINDSAGHLVGDEVLRRLADGLRTSARAEDLVARFGGDEFVLLLPRTSLLQGQALVARIGSRLRDVTYIWGGRAQPLPRVSIGIAAFPDDGLTIEQLIAAADARMYADKSRARGASVSLGDA